MTHRVELEKACVGQSSNRTVGTIISQPILRVLFVPNLVNRTGFLSSASSSSFAVSLILLITEFWQVRTTIAPDKLLQVPSSRRFAFGTLIGASFTYVVAGKLVRGLHLTKLLEIALLSLSITVRFIAA